MPAMESFQAIFDRAAKRHGDADEVEALLPRPKSTAELGAIPDDRYLAEMTRCVFRSGFSWAVIENKWEGFERAFLGFEPRRVAMMSDEDLDRLARDTSIVRNARKIASVRDNALFVRELADEHGNAGRFFAEWPGEDFVGLLDLLKARGGRLGGHTGQMFLRMMGKDGFIITSDVTRALIDLGVISKPPSAKRDLASVQSAFNGWRGESGRSFSEISRTLALSVG